MPTFPIKSAKSKLNILRLRTMFMMMPIERHTGAFNEDHAFEVYDADDTRFEHAAVENDDKIKYKVEKGMRDTGSDQQQGSIEHQTGIQGTKQRQRPWMRHPKGERHHDVEVVCNPRCVDSGGGMGNNSFICT